MPCTHTNKTQTILYCYNIITLNKHSKLSEQQEVPYVVAIDMQIFDCGIKFYTILEQYLYDGLENKKADLILKVSF